jgi:RNA polymerase sigma-70 factor (ECF subfamily)
VTTDGAHIQREGDAEGLLVQQLQQRNASAWAEVYDSHYRKLYLYSYARTGNEAVASDLASKVFLEAVEGIDRYVYRGRPLLAWLYRIARNVVADHMRAREREMRALERAASGGPGLDPGPAAFVAEREDLLAALRQLTEEQQQVIALRFYAGFETAEIARIMERTERAVYSLEARALASLRRLLGPDAERAFAA